MPDTPTLHSRRITRQMDHFILALKTMTPAESILFGFELSHPHPSFRIPIVQQTANNWRRGGGNPGAWPFPFPFGG